MKVTFIDHSCYTVELENHFIVFDYTHGDIEIPDKKTLFVVTHGHGDHYTPDIFKFSGDISYLLSDDIEYESSSKDITFISQDQVKTIGDFKIYAYGSTDLGISVLIEIEDKRIYHSGDLNYWMWPRYTEEDIIQMEKDFTTEVKKVGDKEIDVAMIIVDPRLEDDFDLAGSFYLKLLNSKYFFPMHMWKKYEFSKKFKDKYQELYPNKEIIRIEHENQEFII